MQSHEFYQKFANTPLKERYAVLSNVSTNPLFRMCLIDVFYEVRKIEDKIRPDIIKKEKLLSAVENLWTPKPYK